MWRLLLTCAIISFMPAGVGQAEPRISWPAEMVDDADLHDVFFVDPQVGWAVGDRGAIWHTSDGGEHWALQHTEVGAALRSVYFLDHRHGWVAGGWIEPHTHRGHGVLLRTEDGGATWQRIERLVLPLLLKIRMFDQRRGIVLATPWALFPSGVYATTDGGRTWQNLAADEPLTCVAAAFNTVGEGLLLTPDGQSARLDKNGLMTITNRIETAYPVRAATWLSPHIVFAAGAGGSLWFGSSQGQAWTDIRSFLPGGVAAEFDFHTIASFGPNLWIAGSPGTTVLRSRDAGQTWKVFRTGQTLALDAIHFVDQSRGWGVGGLGVILATRDGGDTWQVQRGSGRRVAVLSVSARLRDIPLSVLAHLAAAGSYRCRAVVVNASLSPGEPFTVSDELRAQAAGVAVGADGVTCLHDFPLAARDIGQTTARIRRRWEQAHAHRGLKYRGNDQLVCQLVRLIRQWRPSAVVVNEPPQDSDSDEQLVQEATRLAFHLAGRTDAFPNHSLIAGLPVWRPDRLLMAAPRMAERSAVRIVAAEPILGLRTSVGALAAEGRVVLEPTAWDTSAIWSCWARDGPSRHRLLDGLELEHGSAARRLAADLVGGDVGQLVRDAQQRENIIGLVAHAATAPNDRLVQLSQLVGLTSSLPAEEAGRLLFDLASGLERLGFGLSAVETYDLLRARYPGHDSSPAAWLAAFQLATSAECGRHWQLRQPGSQRPGDQSPHDQPGFPTIIAPTSLDDRTAAVLQLPRGVHWPMAQRYASAGPILRAEPWVQFAHTAYLRDHQPQAESRRDYERLTLTLPTSSWRSCALAEIWLIDRSHTTTKPIWTCSPRSDRPHLDGRLDEATWRDAEGMRLTTADDASVAEPAEVRWAADDEFLYLAITAPKADDESYEGTAETRKRDIDLGGRDRFEFFLDVNRDYASGWKLTIDHRGWASDACHNDPTWNPTWYIAGDATQKQWTVEAAIPLRELADPIHQRAWNLGVRRILPGRGTEVWPPDATFPPDWDTMGYLLLKDDAQD